MLHMPSPMLFGGDGFDPEALAYISAMTVQPDAARKLLINALIVGLKDAGVWSKIDCLWLIASHDAQAGRLNAKAPATFALTAVSSPTFVTDRGYNCDGSASYLESGFNYASSGGFSLNDAHISAHLNIAPAAAANNNATVAGTTTGTSALRPFASGNTTPVQLNSNFVASGPSVTSGLGFRLQTRTSSTDVIAQAGATQVAVSAASTSVSSLTLALMRRGSNFLEGRIAQASVGRGLTAAEATAFYGHLNTYLSAIGAA